MRRSRQPTGSGLYSISSSALASWRRQFETVPTPNVPGGRYPDRDGRDETRCLPESGSACLSRAAFNSWRTPQRDFAKWSGIPCAKSHIRQGIDRR